MPDVSSLVATIAAAAARIGEISAELARVRGERDRLAAAAFERSDVAPDFGAWLEVKGIMTSGPAPDEDLSERLAEHDRTR